MKYLYLIITLLPLFILGQEKDSINLDLLDSTNFHMLSEFKIKGKNKIKIKNVKYDRIQEKGDTLSLYKITKIDTLGAYYIIEAKNKKYSYRILSYKYMMYKCKSSLLEKGKIYQMDLRSLDNEYSRIHIDTLTVWSGGLRIRGEALSNNDTEIYDGDWEYRIKEGLYNKALSLEGLCLKPDRNAINPNLKISN